MTPLDPEKQYTIGLVCQPLTDAGPDGLTVAELQERTKLDPQVLADVLALCVAREFVKRVERYYGRE